MFYVIAIALTFVSQVTALCSEGCLRCNPNDYCEMCDTASFYVLKEKKCQKISVENCLQINHLGKCQNCETPFYFDQTSLKCVPVEDALKVDKCKLYGTDQVCSYCQKGFFYEDNKCSKVEKNIPACEIYDSATTCKICEENFFTSHNKDSCLLGPNEEYCLFYSQHKCNECKTNYILNYELTEESLMNFNTEEQIEQVTKFFNQANFSLDLIYNDVPIVCQKQLVDNCLQFKSATECITCKDNYYLNVAGQCIRQPNPQIKNCSEYNSDHLCVECRNFYMLINNQCKDVQKVDHCIRYDGSSNTTVCLTCERAYYLENGICKERQNYIPSCDEQTENSETCDICSDGFILSQDKLNCLFEIDYCTEYLPFFKETAQSSLRCNKCDKYYYLENGDCLRGMISQCMIYQNKNQCQICQPQYYLINGECKKSEDISNCLEYSTTSPDLCVLCKDNKYSFLLENTCNFSNEIEYCLIYDQNDQTKCSQCQYGYTLNENKCEKITQSHCAELLNGKCIACEKGFGIDLLEKSQPQCVIVPNQITQNCQKTNLDQDINYQTIQQASCDVCNKEHIPYNFANHFICVRPTLLKFYNLPDEKITKNCIKFDMGRNCIGCQQGYYLDINRNCVEQCQGVHFPFVVSSNSQKGFYITERNFCDNQSSDTSCKVKGFNQYDDISGEGKYPGSICLQCKDHHIPIIKLEHSLTQNHFLHYSLVDPNNTEGVIESPMQKFSQLECKFLQKDYIQMINGSQILDTVPNCEYYFLLPDGNNSYGCLKCQNGFIGKPNSQGYLTDCQQYLGCLDIFNEGLDIEWQNLYSCHQCKNNNQIPFLGMKIIEQDIPLPSQFEPYQLHNLPWSHQSGQNKNIQCLVPAYSSFGFGSTNDFTFPENCGLGFINLNSSTGSNQNNIQQSSGKQQLDLGIFCTACKPGYLATPLNYEIYLQIKIKCEKIENCSENSKWFNSCSECKEGYSFRWSDQKVDYTNCIEQPDENCQASTLFKGKSLCHICKKGYFLNYDNICEKMILENCDTSKDLVLNQNYSTDSQYSYYHSQDGLGCTQCSNGYYSLQINYDENINFCYSSNYSKSQKFIEETNYTLNCENYHLKDQKLQCIQCKEGYGLYMNFGQSICGLMPANCLQIDSYQNCSICQEGYSNVNDLCVKGNIPNCELYETDYPNNEVTCAKCLSGQYLDQNKCYLSKVKYCDIGKEGEEYLCEKCFDGYFLVQNNYINQCLKIPIELQCSEGISESNLDQGGKLKCTKCQNTKKPENQKDIENQCIEFELIEHCKQYNTKKSLIDSSFECIECTDNLYLTNKGKECKFRLNKDENCQIYYPDQDKCLQCESKYYVSTEGLCVSHPTGVAHCQNYDTQQNCKQCKEDYYLENGECEPISKKTLNCKYYDAYQNCIVCDSGYYLNSSKNCVKGEAQNCLTFKDVQTCNSCVEGFGLVADGEGKVNCVEIQIENCVKFQNVQGFPCVQCQLNYYPSSSGICKKVVDPIQNCIQYLSSYECAKCEENYVLKADKTGCISSSFFDFGFDDNCANVEDIPKCVICRSGSYFEIDQCVKCPNSQSCFKCNSLRPYTCDICAQGFYMDKEGICHRNFEIFATEGNEQNLQSGIKEVLCYLMINLILLFQII